MIKNLPIAIPNKKIEEFCQKWKLAELSLFGSVLREDFRPNSDIDVLVTFSPEAKWRFKDQLAMKDELATMFGHTVDLVEKRLVESSKNYIRRRHILTSLERVYVAR